jgi:PTS system nitrogen regulatory IIA component
VDLKLRDAARLLKVSEPTVRRWVRERALPSHRVHDQLRFHRVELQEWALGQSHPLSPALFDAGGDPGSLAAALERGGIFRDVAGDSRQEVLRAVANLPGIPGCVDRALLYELLAAREGLASTAVGEGIAIPHPRDPVVVPAEPPLAVLAFLRRPVEFGAPDGRPVRILFLLLSPSVREHLRMLARLAFALHDEDLRELLRSAASFEAILGRIRALENGQPRPAERRHASRP